MTSHLTEKIIVFIITFVSYALYHSSRKAMSGVKASMTDDWLSNHTHPAFVNTEAEAEAFLGLLDALFMAAYATALFFWGWLGDRLNPKYVISAGMIGSAVTLTAFGAFPKWLSFYSKPYYAVTYILFGLVQACGWPSQIAVMANWWGGGRRGLVMGIWAACQPIGNIFGSFLTGMVLPLGYENTFVMNSALIALGAIVVMVSIDNKPKHHHHPGGTEGQDVEEEEEDKPISLMRAVLLPGVIMYCVCNACLKLVNYAFFFWLPLYLTQAYGWEESHADQLAIFYDVGGIIGSVLGGYISDRMGCRTPLIAAMVACSMGTLLFYSQAGPNLVLNALIMITVGVTVSGPYNLVVGSVSIDLGSQPALAGNKQAMSTVSGLLDGTGSTGSAIGQFLIPEVQNLFGWQAVFYCFIALNGIAVLSILKQAIEDFVNMRRRMSSLGTPLLQPRRGSHADIHEE